MALNEFQTLLEASLRKRVNLEGQVVKGRVVSIDKDMALIDVGLKSEGRVPLKEFAPRQLSVGDEVEVYIDRYEGRMGDAQLSHERARQEASWSSLSDAFRDKKPIEGVIIGQVKGGLTVDILGTTAFLPGSQVDIRPVKDLTHFLGTTQLFQVLKMDDSRSNVVVSRRAILEESRSAGRQNLLGSIEQGQRLDGVVKNLTDYGAFVDLGGIDGLLHITDMAWKRLKHPSELLVVGQKIQVVVTRFNKETQRISLGMKQLEKDPWTTIHELYKIGERVQGVVTNVTDYGAFVELSEGLEGLIYVGEMVWSKKNVDPHQIVHSGQEVTTVILEIDPAKRRVSLGLKQATENPLDRFALKHEIGSTVEAEVKDVTEFGLLVGLPDGINCTVHKNDLSWEVSPDEMLERYSIGMKISLKVLSINPAKEMIGLGVKQLEVDPWGIYFSQWKKGDSITGTVSRILDQGIEVDLGHKMVTMIQRSDLSRDREKQVPSLFSVGEKVEAKIVTLNPDAHFLVLSIKAQEIEDERKAMAEYGNAGESGHSRMGALLGEALETAQEKSEKKQS
jgi:small subunit ribosomal protein S1